MEKPAFQSLHDAACDRGEPAYNDPDTGLFVLTAKFLRARGYCCRRGCRHCPFRGSETSPKAAMPRPERQSVRRAR